MASHLFMLVRSYKLIKIWFLLRDDKLEELFNLLGGYFLSSLVH